MAQGLYGRAEPLFQRALAIQEAALGKNHPDVATSLNNLADLYMEQGLYGRAEPLYQRALAIREAALGKNHPDVADSLHNLAILYVDQGLYGRAEPLYQRALAIREAALGKNHPDVAQSLNSLALLYLEQGLYGRAEPLFQRALAIREAALGKNHPDVARSLNNLAVLRLAQHRLAEALPLFTRAFAISEQRLRQEALDFSEARLASFLQLLRTDEERALCAAARASRRRPRAAPGPERRAAAQGPLRRGDGRHLPHRLPEPGRRGARHLRAVARAAHPAGPALAPRPRLAHHRQPTNSASKTLAERGRCPRSRPGQALRAPARADRAALSRRDRRPCRRGPAQGRRPRRVHHLRGPPARAQTRHAREAPASCATWRWCSCPMRTIRALDLGPAEPIDSRRLAPARRPGQPGRRLPGHGPGALPARLPAPASPAGEHPPPLPLAGWPAGPGALRRPPRRPPVPRGRLRLHLPHLRQGPAASPPGDSPLRPPSSSSPTRTSAPRSRPPPPHGQRLQRGPSAPPPSSASSPRCARTWRSARGLRPLPGTRQEAEAIQRLLPQAQLFLGPEATKERLLHLPTPGILHLATHGFFLEDAPAPKDSRARGPLRRAGRGPARPAPAGSAAALRPAPRRGARPAAGAASSTSPRPTARWSRRWSWPASTCGAPSWWSCPPATPAAATSSWARASTGCAAPSSWREPRRWS